MALSGAELQKALFERLEVLSTQVAMLSAEHGGMGHNSATADLPFGPDERALAERTIAQARAFNDEAQHLSETSAREVGQSLNSLSTKLGLWLLKLTDIYATEAAKSLGKATGVAVAVGLAALANLHEIQALWSGLVRLLTGH